MEKEIFLFKVVTDKENDGGKFPEEYNWGHQNDYYMYCNSKDGLSVGNFPGQSGLPLTDRIRAHVKRTELEMKLDTDDLKITVDLDLEPFDKINNYILNRNLEVIVSKYDTVKNIYYTVFEGSVINYDLDLQKNEMILHCNNITNLLNVKAPSLSYNPSCPFKLYGKKCGVNKTSYKNTFGWNRGTWEISENNTKIYSPNNFLSHDMTKYKNGYIVIRDNGNSSQEIPIVDTTDDSIILLYPISFDFEDISDFDVFYGCNKNINDCENKFNNLLNFGGFRFVPSQNYTNGI